MNVGCRALEVLDSTQAARIPVHALYPTTAAPQPSRFGPYAVDVALDAPLVDDAPLSAVLISHGNGGTPWAYRDLAAALVAAGFAVVLVEHIGNSRTDNALAGTPANLANRPRHLRLALDAAARALPLSDRAAVIGHSIGGYTALAAAGGRPMALPNETADGVAHPVDVTPDPRIRAAVLLAPALPWLMAPGALSAVTIPLLVRAGAADDMTPPAFIERVLAGLPPTTPLNYQPVPNANHFAFMSPFPAALAGPHFPPSVDRPGFDRAGYQPQLAADVIAFLRAALT